MSFAEKGAVGDIDPAFFVGYLYRVKATGTLKFEDAPTQRAIYFRDGRVLFSSSNAPEDQLGAILVAGGKISQPQFDALVAGLEPKQSIASALAQGGHVSQRDIGDAARRKVEQIVGACCVQTTGRYEFEDGTLPKGALDLKLTTEKVLIAAFEALEPSGFLIRILKSPMAVLAAADVEPTEPDLVRLRLTLDGFSSIADIGAQMGLTPAATEVRAAVLIVMGAATVVTSQIEEMALPETGEASGDPSVQEMTLAEEPEPVEAESISFAPSAGEAHLESPQFEAPQFESPQFGSTDSTLTMAAEEPPSPGGNEATLVMGSGLDLLPPPPPRSTKSFGGPRGAPKREKPNTGDLEAVKELLGSPASVPRPPAAAIPNKSWEPVLSNASRGRDRGGLAGLIRNPIAQGVVAVLVLASIGTLAWVYYTSTPAPVAPPSPVPSRVAGAVPVPAASAPVATGQPTALSAPPSAATAPANPAAPPAATGSLKPTPPVALTPIPATPPNPAAPSPAVPSPAAPSPATTKSVAVATASPSPASAATAKPGPTAAAPPPAVAQTPVPTAPSSAAPRPASSVSSAAAYEALKAGRLSEAAAAFDSIARLRSGEFTVQILVACSAQTIAKAVQNDASTDVFILSATFDSKPCHRLLRGFYKTSAEATQAVSTLPAYYTAEGAKPRSVPLKTVLP
jgi:hypothetical protein